MRLSPIFGVLNLFSSALMAAAPTYFPASHGLELREFAKEPMVQNTVAVAVDERGRVYATSVVRRQAADLDIRHYREWIENDLALTSVEQKRAFFRRELVPENESKYGARIRDQNEDGVADWRDLQVLTDRVERMEDRDGDGVADASLEFASGFNTEVTGIAAGLTVWDGVLYATIEPDIVRLEDTDDDGRADRRDVLATGFSVHIGYGGHNFSGPVIGPDGRLYVSVADRGMNVTSKDGRTFYNPHSGAVARCDLDGSNFEIFSYGLRNLQEPAFDAHGNLFGVDNDGDMPGERERFVYVTEGSDHGWRTNWQYLRNDGRDASYQPWLRENLAIPHHAGQPAYITPPLSNYVDGPAGFAFNPGTALNQFYQNHFFLTAFPSRVLYAFKVEPEGAAFRMIGDHAVTTSVLMTGMKFGPDGALYVADWSSTGYEMNEKGGVWKLDDPREAKSEIRVETARLLASTWPGATIPELTARLGHADQRVRMKAQFELVRRNESDTFRVVAGDAARAQLARLHAIWGLGQMFRAGRAEPDAAYRSLLGDPDPEVRSLAARTLGDSARKTYQPDAALRGMLRDSEARPRFFAAIALGALRDAAALPEVIAYLARDGADPYHRHAAIMGLTGCATASQLAALVVHESVAVRLGAVVALRRQAAPEVAAFLRDRDPLVAAEAASAIHDDESIPASLPALAEVLAAPAGAHERTVRRALSSAQRLREPRFAALVADFARDESQSQPLRLHALNLLGTWPAPARLDTVEGRSRPLPVIAAARIAPVVEEALRALSKAADPELTRVAWEAAAVYQIEQSPVELLAVVDRDTPVAAEALKALAKAEAATYRRAALRAIASQHVNVQSTALAALATVSAVDFLEAATRFLASPDTPLARAAITLLKERSDEPSNRLLLSLMARLQAGSLDPALAFDVLESARASEDKSIIAAVAAYDQARNPTDPLAPYLETMAGGDPVRGMDIFTNSVVAQCTLCHSVGRGGSLVGPNLRAVGVNPPRFLLESLVNPGAVVTPGYGIVSVTLTDGNTLGGTLLAENETTLTVKLSEEDTRSVNRSEIASSTPPVSAMPPLGLVIEKRELRDLLAYLQTLKPRELPKETEVPATNEGG